MSNNYKNAILPLTIKQLKKAQQQLKQRKAKVYDSTTYQIITIVARIVKLGGLELTVTDQTEFLDLIVYADPLKQSIKLVEKHYYKFSFVAKKNILKGNNVSGFGFEIIAMSYILPNEITAHMATVMTQKICRQVYKRKTTKKQSKKPTTHIEKQSQTVQAHIMYPVEKKVQNLKVTDQNLSTIQKDITTYCQNLGQQFDVEKIMGKFANYEVKEIHKVLEILGDKGLIMDLGLVYQWVGDQ